MREIKFRGKRLDSNKWVYGDYREPGDGVYIYVKKYGMGYEVDSETVGQFTEFIDSDKTDIYADDILEDEYGDKYLVVFVRGTYMAKSLTKTFADTRLSELLEYRVTKVIGNTHDNPELTRTVSS